MPANPVPGDLLRASLSPTDECPPIERIEDASVKSHVETCGYCKTELAMLKSFREADVPTADAAAIAQIAERLRANTCAPKPVVSPGRPSWIEKMFGGGWLRPAMLATVGALLVAGIAMELRNRAPAFDPGAATGQSAFRSGSVTIESPIGDVQSAPEQIRWQTVPTAASYRVHLMEVDQHELWSADSVTAAIAIPSEVRAQVVPLKTLLIEVDALDAKGNKAGHSEVVRFRLLQSFYSH